MTFSKAPGVETYSTKKVKLTNVWESRNRTATKDNENLNLFYEFVNEKKTGDSDFHVVKRPGCAEFITSVTRGFSDPIRSFYHWEDQNLLVFIVLRDILLYNAATGVYIKTLTNVFAQDVGDVGFTEYLYSTDTVSLLMTDGVTYGELSQGPAWTFAVPAAGEEPPTPHLPYVEYIDGYVFLVKVGSADIYNSVLEEPLNFTGYGSGFISTEMLPDTIVRLGKLNNYLIAFGTASIEYFWNSGGGDSTGTPMQRYDTPVKYIGYLGGYATLSNKIYFVGNSATAAPDVYILEDLKITEISDPVLRRYLLTLKSFTGNIVSLGGHDFYWITAGEFTYAYDLDNALWHRMSWQAQADFPIDQAHTLFIPNVGNSTLFFLVGGDAMYYFSDTVYKDLTVNFPFKIITDPEMFDTYNRKTIGRISVVGDRPPVDADLEMQSTDDDYKTWSPVRRVNLNQEIPKFEQNGQTRRRAWKITVTADVPVRLKELEVEVNKGQG